MNNGLIHLYTGEGKGKTTAAMGLALRAAGAGKKVLILQFMKGRDTGELHSIAHIPAIRILRSEKDFGFFSSMSQADKEALTKIHNRLLDEAVRQVSAGEAELQRNELAEELGRGRVRFMTLERKTGGGGDYEWIA